MTRCGPIRRAAVGASAPKTANAITGSEVSSPAAAADMPRPSRTSSSTGPTLTAAGRRLKDSSTSPTSTGESRVRRSTGSMLPVLEVMRHISDGERRTRLATAARDRPGDPGRRPGGGDAGDDGAALDRARDGLPLAAGPRRRPDASPTSTGPSTRTGPWSSSWRCAARCSCSRATCCPAAWGSASARVATQLAARLAKEVEAAGHTKNGAAWIDRARAEVVEALAGGNALTAQQVREQVPVLESRLEIAPGTKYAASVSLAPRVLTQLGGRGHGGARRQRRPLAAVEASLDADARLARRRTPPEEADAGYAELVRRWLRTFGPGTETDIVWWLGSTKTAVRRALADVEAVEVSLDGGGTGWVLPGRRGRPGGRRRAVGRAAAGAGPDRDGLEGARLLPRRPRPPALRQQRQRRDHGVVGRPRRGLLGAGRRRRGRGAAAGAPAAGGDGGAGGRGGAPDRLAGRHPRRHGLPFGRDEGSEVDDPSAREQPEQQAPPVQRLRVRYAKRGRLRFTSHRDFSRAFERAVFRARVPMAYSSGFNPHPRISYAGAAPTGSASEAEYLELALARWWTPPTSTRSLAEALPDGLDVVEVVVSAGGSLSDLLEASRWRLDVPGTEASSRPTWRRSWPRSRWMCSG